MTSKAFARNSFLRPDENSAPSHLDGEIKYRKANVYDAVAGKISSQGYIPNIPRYASTRDTTSSSTTAVPPENVLYRRHDAPLRYAESDVYFENERKSNLKLPESDLLKAVHAYASDFYSRAVPDGRADHQSMDETALLALGILLEETAREGLGRTGDLTFTEGEELVQESSGSNRRRTESSPPKVKRRRVGY